MILKRDGWLKVKTLASKYKITLVHLITKKLSLRNRRDKWIVYVATDDMANDNYVKRNILHTRSKLWNYYINLVWTLSCILFQLSTDIKGIDGDYLNSNLENYCKLTTTTTTATATTTTTTTSRASDTYQ